MTQSLFGLPGLAGDAGKAALSPGEPADFERAREAWRQALEREALRLRRSPDFNPADADVRFSTSLPGSRVEGLSVAIVGAGGIGNWQWRVILGMGFRCVALYDDDVVSIENVGPQAHNITDIGLPKVEAVRRAALAYRAGNILARPFRVQTLGDIVDDLGFMPDIVIGCTDSAQFRNGFIEDLRERCLSAEQHLVGLAPDGRWEALRTRLPEIWLDFRMALGDWHCFAIPLRRMAAAEEEPGLSREDFWRQYTREAVFPPETAVREPCTERAIAYTGANTASYTGAFLHWWLTRGCFQLHSLKSLGVFFGLRGRGVDPDLDDVAFRWLMTYSSRDWEQGTPTRMEEFLRAGREAERKVWSDKHENAVFLLENLVEREIGRSVRLIEVSDWKPGDYAFTPGRVLRCVDPAVMGAGRDASLIPLRDTSGNCVAGKRIAAVFRPRSSLPEDVRYTAVPGLTRIKSAIRNADGGRLHLVGKAGAEGNVLTVCGHDVWSADEVGPCDSPEIGAAYAAFSDLAEGDVVALPSLPLSTWRITGKWNDRLEARSLRPGFEQDRLIADSEANIVLLAREGEEPSRAPAAA